MVYFAVHRGTEVNLMRGRPADCGAGTDADNRRARADVIVDWLAAASRDGAPGSVGEGWRRRRQSILDRCVWEHVRPRRRTRVLGDDGSQCLRPPQQHMYITRYRDEHQLAHYLCLLAVCIITVLQQILSIC